MPKHDVKFFHVIAIGLIITCCVNPMYSQNDFEEFKREANRMFDLYKTARMAEFESYRAKVNQEFADYMSKAWPEFTTEPAIPTPDTPEPPTPEVAPFDAKPSNEPIPFSKVTPKTLPPKKPNPLVPEDDLYNPLAPDQSKKRPDIPEISFTYYGKKCKIPFSESLHFTLHDVNEKNVAQAWQRLAGRESTATVSGCIRLRDNLHLSDWGYLKLIEKFAKTVFPDNRNESQLLQMFLLTQSGYKVRIGKREQNLIVLVPCDEMLYTYRYIPIDGTKYYVIDRSVELGATQVFNHKFPGEQIFSLIISEHPELPIEATNPGHFQSTFNPSINLNVSVNKNLIDFYNDYPLSSHWNIYAKISLSEHVKKQIYPLLKKTLEGKDELEAAGMLLHFLQTGFDYKTDEEQFGFEKAFFPDETFFYPFCDCEDRAILFAVLVRELIGLDVVLVHYPGHLATAVKFNNEVTGDYFDVNGSKYIVCDPTYINAGVGMAMRQYKDSAAEIVIIS